MPIPPDAQWDLGDDYLGRATRTVLASVGITPAQADTMTHDELKAVPGLTTACRVRLAARLTRMRRAADDAEVRQLAADLIAQVVADIDWHDISWAMQLDEKRFTGFVGPELDDLQHRFLAKVRAAIVTAHWPADPWSQDLRTPFGRFENLVRGALAHHGDDFVIGYARGAHVEVGITVGDLRGVHAGYAPILAELKQLRAERDRYRTAWHNARRRARYAEVHAETLQNVLDHAVAAAGIRAGQPDPAARAAETTGDAGTEP